MKKKPSIRDIAQKLGISITTVSFILNGKAKEKRISEALTQKVQELVKEMDYKPNQLAQSLRTGKTKIIGLMVEDISNPFFASVARLIEENAYKKGYKIIYCSTEDDVVKTRDLIRMFRDRQLDGYIITPTEGIQEDIRQLINEKVPVVLFDRYFPELLTDYVGVNNLESAFLATEHLVKQGHKKVAIVTVESGQTQMRDRLRGYELALEKYQLTPCVRTISFKDSYADTIQELVSFFDNSREIDAVFFATNYLAIRGVEAIQTLGLSVPDDLAVVTFDDHEFFRLLKPSLTAVVQPVEELALEVINLILNQLENQDVQLKEMAPVVLRTSMVVRESSLEKKMKRKDSALLS